MLDVKKLLNTDIQDLIKIVNGESLDNETRKISFQIYQLKTYKKGDAADSISDEELEYDGKIKQ